MRDGKLLVVSFKDMVWRKDRDENSKLITDRGYLYMLYKETHGVYILNLLMTWFHIVQDKMINVVGVKNS